MIKNVEVKITRTEAHTKMSVKWMSSDQGQSVIFTDSSVKKSENTQNCWSHSSASTQTSSQGKHENPVMFFKDGSLCNYRPIILIQRYEKFKKILSGNQQGLQLWGSWQGWVEALGKADQAIKYYECPQGPNTYFHGKRNQRQ